MTRLLAFLGGHATWVLFVGVFVGLALPSLSALARPLLAPAVAVLLTATLVRIDWQVMLGYLRRPWLAAVITAIGTEVNEVITTHGDIQVVLNDTNSVSLINKPVQDSRQLGDIIEVKSGGRLVQDIENVTMDSTCQLTRQLESLSIAT